MHKVAGRISAVNDARSNREIKHLDWCFACDDGAGPVLSFAREILSRNGWADLPDRASEGLAQPRLQNRILCESKTEDTQKL